VCLTRDYLLFCVFILTLYFLHASIISRAFVEFQGRDSRLLQRNSQSRRKAGGKMNALDRFMEYFVAGVFLCVGLAKIWSYQRRPKPLGAQPARLPFGLPYGLVIAVALFEVLAALALPTPYSFLPHVMIAPLAIAGLALLTWSAAFYHMRRRESAVPNLALFLLVMFVAVARWI
jgi:hypothetical protein